MSYQKSFSEIDNKHWHDYKKRLNETENVLDTKKVFSMCVANLLADIDPAIGAKYGEFESDLMVEGNRYVISQKISENPVFKTLLETSDLPAILQRYADAAEHRIVHQTGNTPKHTGDGKKIVSGSH